MRYFPPAKFISFGISTFGCYILNIKEINFKIYLLKKNLL